MYFHPSILCVELCVAKKKNTQRKRVCVCSSADHYKYVFMNLGHEQTDRFGERKTKRKFLNVCM